MNSEGQSINFAVSAAPGEKLFVMSILALKQGPSPDEGDDNLLAGHVPTIYSAPSHEVAVDFGYELARIHFLEAEGWHKHDVVATEIDPNSSSVRVTVQS